ncbi:4-hydroxybutyrate dehydrogenase [Tissierella carlieri]|jgi:4-hydroxybutyrate dehydrogenase|uniref:4-hydroxybutyrate dehydrogenase n=1 Tax=Tissierella TaxID=41273 RepID=UPI001C129254|nr:4-hydroxybutyrate dehydrogenase [Tissierella carlieri]MBU5314325.1 4-hydroxybutyrate dehydrogenase [Tissierella carlieri]MDU5080646.1 4-hydroxybutyrate dehydrogenase [Bacillota bacterium]
MRQLVVKPEIYKFNSCTEFIKAFPITEKDLVLTNEYIYQPYFGHLNLPCHIVYQEKYGLGEPSDEMIDRIFNDIKDIKFNRIIAIGGGSVIDIAKLFVIKDAANTLELFEKTIPMIKDKELIIIPTTCGTGSEATNISIAELKSKGTKMGLAIDELYADYAIMIPEMVKTLPYKFFVTSSIDALIHAIESLVSPKSNCYTELFSIKAIEIILKGYLEIIEKGEEYRTEIIEDFLIASNYAGIAFANTGVGAVHALSYPVGGTYHVPHGEVNYQFFVEVFKTYNRLNPNGKIKDVNKMLGGLIGTTVENVYDELEKILNNLLPKKSLKEYGMKEEEIEEFTVSVLEKQQRLLANNYTELSRDEIKGIFARLY